MLDICQGHRRKALAPVWAAALGVVFSALGKPALAASADVTAHTPGLGFWLFASLALLLVGGLAYSLGVWRAGVTQASHLFTLRSALHQQQQLQDQHRWATDAHHQWLFWQLPGQPDVPSAHISTPPFAAAMAPRLQAQQAFSGLHQRCPQAWQGAQFWALQGVPHLDQQGQFAGFVGTARPLDEASVLGLKAQALAPLMQAHEGAALLAAQHGDGWRLLAFNSAALRLWPTLVEGADWAGLADQLALEIPSPLLADVQAQMQSDTLPATAPSNGPSNGPNVQAPGWRFEALGPTALGGRGVLLTQRAPAGPPTAPAPGDVHESDSFSFTVSHDLRAPIRVVEGFTRIVKEDYGKLLDRVGNEHLDRVLGAASRMNLMIDALLTLARLSTQPLAQQPVNLSQLAAYIIDDLRRSAPERQADVDIEPALQAHGDPTLLRLVLENLLGNAWKYSARCHRTQISLRTVPHAGPPGSNAGRAFVVRDNGAGFDMRSAERLFGLFQRLHSHSDFPGHGVGLASVRRIVKRHGGDIWAEAEVGRGAAFFFTLAG
jgi:signal transduction histidine kinase